MKRGDDYLFGLHRNVWLWIMAAFAFLSFTAHECDIDRRIERIENHLGLSRF